VPSPTQISGNLLIVDSDQDFRTNIEAAFDANKWQVVQSTCPKNAVDICAWQQFDVIFLEADPFDPECLTSISKLRFGEGMCRRATIIASSRFAPGEFADLTVRAGADIFVKQRILATDIVAYLTEASTRRLISSRATDYPPSS